jgi:deoxyribonuclease V
MILAVDVKYSENGATVAGVVFAEWRAKAPEMVVTSLVEVPAEYEPGQFYKRELPCILRLIDEHELHPQCIVVDGFVYLDGHSRAGLGKQLYDALSGKVPVIGVAKKPFRGIGQEYEVYRGASKKPLYVTAVGIDLNRAKESIRSMHGNYRQPTLLKKADLVSRSTQCVPPFPTLLPPGNRGL